MHTRDKSDGISRRMIVTSVPAAGACLLLAPGAMANGRVLKIGEGDRSGPMTSFPAQDRALVREIVGASHRSLERVTELLEQAPRLANAAWDWGFGDWETALGAASHTGRRAIAELLLEHGARVDVFCLAMLGRTAAVKAMVEASPGLQRVRGPHGLSLMHHARAGADGAREVVEYLESLGDADVALTDLPLTDEQRKAYSGVYVFGEAPGEGFEVFVQERDKRLAIRERATPGGAAPTARNLLHLGEHGFHPVGAPEVRLMFAVEGDRAVRVSITTPGPLCEASRAEA